MTKIIFSVLTFFSVVISKAQTTYTFTGNGLWTTAANWSNNSIPPDTLKAGAVININPVAGGSCTLNKVQYIYSGSSLIIATNAKFIINNNVIVKAAPATLTTNVASSIGPSFAVSGGKITANGGSVIKEQGIAWSTNPNPTARLSTKIIDTTKLNNFSITITGLTPVTLYYVRAYAINSVDTSYGNQVSFVTSSIPIDNPPTLATVTIGTQTFTSSNLTGVRYRNGDPIPQVTDPQQWANIKYGAWCYYNNDSANLATYGRLYNWYAVNDPRGLAPDSFHIPADHEWTTLVDYLGGEQVAGGKMKANAAVWKPNIGTNSSGFTGIPGGIRDEDNDNIARFYTKDTVGNWWSATANGSSYAWGESLLSLVNSSVRDFYNKNTGFSVRCIKNVNEKKPVLTTIQISDSAQHFAMSGGNVTDSGGTFVYVRGICWNTSPLPTIINSKTVEGSGIGSFESKLTGLLPGLTYYVRAYAVNGAGVSYGNQVSFTTLTDIDGVFNDSRDGQAYHYKSIGTQVWMTRNLNYTGPSSVCYDSLDSMCNIYGKLYLADSVLQAIPNGWHLPSSEELAKLSDFILKEYPELNLPGGELKDSSGRWDAPNTGARNRTGFSGLPGGMSYGNDSFEYAGKYGVWWKKDDEYISPGMALSYDSEFMVIISVPVGTGLSIRCIRD